MSYILDALKKSEKKRQHAEVPNVLTVQDAFLQQPRKRRMWPYLILVALLVNAGIAMWFFGPWQPRKASVPAPATSAKQVVAKPQEPPPPVTAKTAEPETAVAGEGSGVRGEKAAPKEKPLEAKPLQQKQAAEATAAQKKAPDKGAPQVDTRKTSEKQRAAAENDNKSAVVPARQAATTGQPPTEASTGEEIVPPPAPGRIYTLNDLPAVLKQKLPAITISVSLYSDDPASRLVRVNGEMLREGQFLSAGLKVEQIAPDGVIFSFQNYRFRVGLR